MFSENGHSGKNVKMTVFEKIWKKGYFHRNMINRRFWHEFRHLKKSPQLVLVKSTSSINRMSKKWLNILKLPSKHIKFIYWQQNMKLVVSELGTFHSTQNYQKLQFQSLAKIDESRFVSNFEKSKISIFSEKMFETNWKIFDPNGREYTRGNVFINNNETYVVVIKNPQPNGSWRVEASSASAHSLRKRVGDLIPGF